MSEDSKAYQRGYNAGRRRTEQEMQKTESEYLAIFDAQKVFRREALLAITTAMITSTREWKIGDKPVTKVSEYVGIAEDFARTLSNRAFR